ncbi:uncharacterized protein RCC_07646 [Ramularia collo-cygni]|uniref:Uncharacterized protein n=1 Tax=Ramularia collo-cygni TaxID=112498 RepID=A0A2D3UY24_9PEZI|nr:uncharacterized protein RCC_07646 [Ramularia collo-cygni]CZT21781.1 uncharacterized protein RCC_07646 [Ramularia collo-cygni]
MQYLPILLAASAAFVGAQKALEKPPSNYRWSARNFIADCTDTCHYTFDISGVEAEPYPSFKAVCTGTASTYFASCQLLEWSAKRAYEPTVLALVPPPGEDEVAHLQVSLIFDSYDASYNITGPADLKFNGFETDFDIVPTDPLGTNIMS